MCLSSGVPGSEEEIPGGWRGPSAIITEVDVHHFQGKVEPGQSNFFAVWVSSVEFDGAIGDVVPNGGHRGVSVAGARAD